MKFKLLAILLSSLFTSQAFAECKSVMGACVKQDLVNAAPHMRSDYVEKRKVVKVVKVSPAVPATNNTTTNTATNNKNTAKKTNSTGVFSTMQKVGM